MSKGGFGSELWKNVEAVRFGKRGGIDVPVLASSRQGIVVGVRPVTTSDAAVAAQSSLKRRERSRLWRRVFGRESE